MTSTLDCDDKNVTASGNSNECGDVIQIVEDVRKSPEDERTYQAIELRNGIRILLISDPTTDKAAACLNVRAGFVSDPSYLPGLAHFCEHMLFLGTKQYPEENYFEKFVHEHGGYSNAETDKEHTSYYYEVQPSFFLDSLRIFASFFTDPLFNESALEREVEAVQAEDESSAKDDACRLAQIEAATGDLHHDFSKFGAGNRRTLTEFVKNSNSYTIEFKRLSAIERLYQGATIGNENGETVAKKCKLDDKALARPTPNGLDSQADRQDVTASWSSQIRSELMDFFQKCYSSNVMTLSVLSNHSIAELSAAVVSCFRGLPNHKVPLRTWVSPYAEPHLGVLVRAVPLTNMRQLELTFPLPDCSARYPAKPAYFISYLLTSEAPRGLLAMLKRRGLVNSMDASLVESLTGFWLFKIVYDLTDAALVSNDMDVHSESYEQSAAREVESSIGLSNVYDIVHATFSYLRLISERGIESEIFDELSRLAEIEFRFEEKQDPLDAVLNGASDLHEYSLRDVLAGGVLLDEFDPHLVRSLLFHCVPRNLRLMLIAKQFERELPREGGLWQSEKWYGARYRVDRIAEEHMLRWQQCEIDSEFHLPEPNVFIPTTSDFQFRCSNSADRPTLIAKVDDVSSIIESIEQSRQDAPIPKLIVDDDRVRCWFVRDQYYRLPKSVAYFQLLAPRVALSSPLRACALDMLVALFSDSEKLAAITHSASVAGNSFEMKACGSGCALFFSGYLSTLQALLEAVLAELVAYRVDTVRFEAVCEAYRRDLLDDETAPTDSQADATVTQLLSARAWSASDRLHVLDYLTVETLEQTHRDLLAELFVEALVYGNADEHHALEFVHIVRQRLGYKPAHVAEIVRNRQVSLRGEIDQSAEADRSKRVYFKFERVNPVQAVSTVHVYLQIGVESLASVVRVSLFQHLISEAFFDQLRTREQLGYALDCVTRLESGCVGLSLFIATRCDLQLVESRIEHFLAAQISRLRSMSTAEFNKHKSTFVRELLVRPKQLATQAEDMWDEIACCLYDYARTYSEALAACNLTLEELIAFCDVYIAFDAVRRAKLVVYVHGKGELDVQTQKSTQSAAASNTRVSAVRERRNVCSRGRLNGANAQSNDSDASDEDSEDSGDEEADDQSSLSGSDDETQQMNVSNTCNEAAEASAIDNHKILPIQQSDQQLQFNLGQPTIIDNAHRFKSYLPLFPLPQPAINLPSHGSGTTRLEDIMNRLANQPTTDGHQLNCS